MRGRVLVFVSLLLALSANADAQTVTKPPAPYLTIGGNLKELIFDWDPVPGVGTYRLFANTGLHGYF